MGRNSVAVLDIRSGEIAIFLGERGVNHTFVFKASKTEEYDGYEDGAFYDVGNLADAVFRAISSVEQTCGERIRTLYVGVPGEFSYALPKEQDIGFPKKRKIGEKELAALFESGKEELKGYRFIRASSMIFTTADNRRVVDPKGLYSTGLSALLTYFYCTDYFADTLEGVFENSRITLRFLPAQLAMANYLIPSETRDEYALFLDAGFLSSTVSIHLGNGILAQKTVWAGKGQIAFLLMQRFSLPYDAALALLPKANLFSKPDGGSFEFMFRGASYEIASDKLAETVKEGLDGLCEGVGGFLEQCSGKELDYKPLYVTGEGLIGLRGALEHISKRLNRVCEQTVPNLPYYNKADMSSRIALVDMACEDNRKSGFFYRLLNGFGG